MQNQSMFVKLMIWFMVFLMSVGFGALVVTPFLGVDIAGGGGDGRDAQRDQMEEARAAVADLDCEELPEQLGEAGGADASPGKAAADAVDDGPEANVGDEGTGATRAAPDETAPEAVDEDREERIAECKDSLQTLGGVWRALSQPADVNDPEAEFPSDAQLSLEQALDAYLLAYRIDPTDRETAETLAGFYLQSGNAQESIAVWDALAARYPKDQDILESKAAAQQQAGQLPEAKETLEEILERFPETGASERIEEQIASIEEQIRQQEEQQAAQQAAGLDGSNIDLSSLGGAGGQPITVG